uniref:CS domain-containing protein n=1 Tax=Amphora coffeiformis TaxID=265554 RepID=A0A7S3L4D1_9STRA|eukprot:scaffold9779_cov175-Amphora_coffeaeformis.AAC.2
MPLSGTFEFVKIPANASEPIESHKADKAGGLSDDALVKFAKNYFFETTGAKKRARVLENASAAERQVLAAQVRTQLASSGSGGDNKNSTMISRLNEMDDDTVLDMIYRNQSQPSCDISALTVPTAGNNFKAVSMYSADSAKEHGLPRNERATALMVSCGHAAPDGGMYGDVFVGRAADNEATDIWERVDFTVADADPKAAWCETARSSGGGGGSGAAAASSLSNLVQQQQGMKITDGAALHNNNDTTYGYNGAPPVRESWGTWSQTDDEVELKLAVAAGTKAKYCKVNFSRTALKVTVAGNVLLQGTLFDPIALDESTFTLQDEGPTGRELAITLGKSDPRKWSFITR